MTFWCPVCALSPFVTPFFRIAPIPVGADGAAAGAAGGRVQHKKWMNPMRPSIYAHGVDPLASKFAKRVGQNGPFEPAPPPAITSSMTSLENKLEEALTARKSAGLMRQLRQNAVGVDFSSNDYLGLSRSPELKERIDARLAAETSCLLGSTGSRLISGNDAEIEALEAKIADFHHAPAALLFGSGYAANTGIFSCLAGTGDTLVLDELIHASMIDGARLSKADRIIFKHNDLGSLEQALTQAKGTKVVGIESVYSMDGDVAALADIVDLAERFDASVIVDEAHSTGILGPDGRGLVVAEGLEDRIFARVHTFGKALGLHGAAIVGSDLLRNYLMNFARSFIYATAPPPHLVASAAAAYASLLEIQEKRDRLFALIECFRRHCADSPYRWLDSDTWIQALIIPGNQAVRNIANELRAQSFWTVPIVSPTVPVGMERIRICLHAFNTEEEIERLHGALEGIVADASADSAS